MAFCFSYPKLPASPSLSAIVANGRATLQPHTMSMKCTTQATDMGMVCKMVQVSLVFSLPNWPLEVCMKEWKDETDLSCESVTPAAGQGKIMTQLRCHFHHLTLPPSPQECSHTSCHHLMTRSLPGRIAGAGAAPLPGMPAEHCCHAALQR